MNKYDSQHFSSQIVISVVKKTMKTKGKYKEKQRALLKVWLQKCRNLATLDSNINCRIFLPVNIIKAANKKRTYN